VRGLQQQYVDTTVSPDQARDPAARKRAEQNFQQKLLPSTIEELRLAAPGSTTTMTPEGPRAEAPIVDTRGRGATPTAGAAPPLSVLPNPGDRVRNPVDGTVWVNRNGKVEKE
jgi:hypothetical protein